MAQLQSLAGYFAGWAGGRPAREAVAATISALADASVEFAELLGRGALAGPLGPRNRQARRGRRAEGDRRPHQRPHRRGAAGGTRRRRRVGGDGWSAPARREGPAARRRRSARRLVQHRCQRLDRHDLHGAAGARAQRGAVRLPAAGRQPAGRRLLRLRAADRARLERRRRHADLHPRSQLAAASC